MYPHGFRFSDNQEFEVRKTFGIGMSGMIRYEFIKLYGHNLYAEMGPGILMTSHKFPPLGTLLNFTQRYGFGTNIPLNKKVILIFGVRHLHISNGKGMYLGVKFKK
ncbi:acyloxyacyl hydrolase [bacterium]|nr:acyloxyacyl hydrolase [bacterium]